MELIDLIKIVGNTDANNIKKTKITIRLQDNSFNPFGTCSKPLEVFEKIHYHWMFKIDKRYATGSEKYNYTPSCPIYNESMEWTGYVLMGRLSKNTTVTVLDIDEFWNTPNIFVPEIFKYPGGISGYRHYVDVNGAKHPREVAHIKNELQHAVSKRTANDSTFEYWRVSHKIAASIAFRGKQCFDELVDNPYLMKFIPY